MPKQKKSLKKKVGSGKRRSENAGDIKNKSFSQQKGKKI